MADEPLLMRVRAALAGVKEPGGLRNIVAGGRVQGLSVSPTGVVRFTLEHPDLSPAALDALADEAKAAAEAVDGVARVAAVATAHRAPGGATGPTPAPPTDGHANPLGLKKKPRIAEAAESLSGVRHVVAIASGKGGVGKSTVAANLAVALARQGHKVGLLDADIYGPSLPTLFGLAGRPEIREGRVQPVAAFGVKAMSIGLLVDPEKALAWRGPMVMGALRQLMTDVEWGALDILVIDTPPGTGDVHLSLAQSNTLSGAVIVSTPQALALADVRRGVEFFRKTGAPILGVIENMAWYETPDGSRQYLFGEGGAERAAAELDAPFLGALPLYPALREASDAGAPIVAAAPDSEPARRLAALAEKIAAALTR